MTTPLAGAHAKPDDTVNVARGGKFLAFFLSDEEYGIEILRVQEIIGLLPITRVPYTQNYLKGVVNLRGKVIPVIDLRLKFGMPASERTSETCIVVVHLRGIEVGLIVDRVSEVVDIRDEDVGPAPSFGNAVDTEYIYGIGKSQGRVKILLDIEKALPSMDILQYEESATHSG